MKKKKIMLLVIVVASMTIGLMGCTKNKDIDKNTEENKVVADDTKSNSTKEKVESDNIENKESTTNNVDTTKNESTTPKDEPSSNKETVKENVYTLDNISEKTKLYITEGQVDKSNADKIKWSTAFLNKVDIKTLYKKYMDSAGKPDDIESFALYMTKNAPIAADWKELFGKDLFDAYGVKVARLEPLKDYPDYYQAYVLIDGSEKPYVVVSSRTGYYHG